MKHYKSKLLITRDIDRLRREINVYELKCYSNTTKYQSQLTKLRATLFKLKNELSIRTYSPIKKHGKK